MTTLEPKAPTNLSAAGRDWWRRIQKEYEIVDAGGLLVLTVAAEALDRMKEAQQVIVQEGLIVTDRHGQLKAHPCTQIERDNRSQLLSAVRVLGLNLEPVRDHPGRPNGKPFGLVA